MSALKTTRSRFLEVRRSTGKSAFSLIEVVIALGITAFCLVALLGLFSVGVNASRESSEQLQAAHLAQSLIDTRRASPNAAFGPTFPLPLLGTNATTAKALVYVDGDGLVSPSAQGAQFGLSYQVTAPSSANTPVKLHLCLFWPAQATLATASGRYEVFTQLPY